MKLHQDSWYAFPWSIVKRQLLLRLFILIYFPHLTLLRFGITHNTSTTTLESIFRVSDSFMCLSRNWSSQPQCPVPSIVLPDLVCPSSFKKLCLTVVTPQSAGLIDWLWILQALRGFRAVMRRRRGDLTSSTPRMKGGPGLDP